MNPKIILGIAVVIGILLFTGSQMIGVADIIASIAGSVVGGTGGAVLSLSQVDFISNDPQVGGQAWLLTMVQNGQGQYAVGNFDNAEITDEDKSAEYDLTVRMDVNEQKCEYPIVYQGNQIKHASYFDRQCYGPLCTLCSKSCDGDTVKEPGFTPCYCVYKTNTASYGSIGTPTTSFRSTLKATSHGETVQGEISNMGTTSVWLGDKVYASWVGSLVSGDQCPIASDYRRAAAYTGSWKIIDDTRYQSYRAYDISGFTTCKDLARSGSKKVTDCVNEYNIYEANALAGASFTSTGGSSATTSGTANDGKVSINLNRLIQYPMITMRIKAAWIGIVIPVGKPSIVSVTSSPFQTGSTGFVVATIKNVGDGQGSFEASVQCTSGFSQQGTTQYITLNAGQQGTVNIPITATCQSDIGGSCSLVVTDRNNPNQIDTKSVGVNCKAIILCDPGLTRCNGNYAETCRASGSGWDVTQRCNYKCEMRDGVATCISPDCESSDQCDPGYVCQNGVCVRDILNWVKMLANWVKMLAVGLGIAAVILWLLPFVPFLAAIPFIGLLRKPKYFVIAVIIVGVLILLVFTIPIASLTASIVGG